MKLIFKNEKYIQIQCEKCGKIIKMDNDVTKNLILREEDNCYIMNDKVNVMGKECNIKPKCPKCKTEYDRITGINECVIVKDDPKPKTGFLNGLKKAFNESIEFEKEKQIEKERKSQEPIRCPKCGSTQITADKKGFGIGKAIAGDLVAGTVGGLVAGSMGKDKIIITCLNCGHKWKAGKKK